MSARSTDQFSKLSRRSRVLSLIPISRAQAAIGRVWPLNESRRILLLFRACSAYVAHRQFSGEYGPSLSIRSMLCFGDGRGPISLKKFSNNRHRGATVMPRPPYLLYELALGLSHRFRMPDQIAYSTVLDWWCVTALRYAESLKAQRHLSPRFAKRLPRLITTTAPQTHWQINWPRPACWYPVTVREPKRWPTDICCFVTLFFTKLHAAVQA